MATDIKVVPFAVSARDGPVVFHGRVEIAPQEDTEVELLRANPLHAAERPYAWMGTHLSPGSHYDIEMTIRRLPKDEEG